jgi:hypothetical protein
MIAPTNARSLTEISVERVCACPFSIAQEYAEEYLRGAERGSATPLAVSPFAMPLMRRPVAMSFSLANDETEPGRAHESVLIRWEAGIGVLPDFRGTIRFRAARRETLVRIEGRYAPPLGRTGAVFDRLIGKWIATRTMSDLLRRIAARLELRQRDWLRRQDSSGR